MLTSIDLLKISQFEVGQTFESLKCEITEKEIIQLESYCYPTPFHLGKEEAISTCLNGLLASNLDTAAVTMKLLAVAGGLSVSNELFVAVG